MFVTCFLPRSYTWWTRIAITIAILTWIYYGEGGVIFPKVFSSRFHAISNNTSKKRANRSAISRTLTSSSKPATNCTNTRSN